MLKKQLLPLFFVLLVAAAASFAQNTASIKGTVTDQNGAAVNGATVNVKNVSQGIDRSTQTSESGQYEVPALPPGTYSVQVQKQGFQPQQTPDLVLAVARDSVQNFSLK